MLERLKKIDLRKAWKSEDQEFTPWLANEENLVDSHSHPRSSRSVVGVLQKF